MSDNNGTEAAFHVVGIGASAGGLEALEKFFSHVAVDSGLAFVVVQHLSPDYKSLMGELLSKWTPLPIHVAQDGMEIKPNNVYLIPRNKNLTVFHQKLYLADRDQDQLNLPIDIFLQSLAEDLGEKAIAVILSGTGSDGTRGIRFVKEQGGMVMAQDPKTAKFDGMPRSAIATQLVDYVLPPEQMPREILNYVQHPCLTGDSSLRVVLSGDEDTLSKIFALLRTQSGVDFTYYKQNTMLRRIERRMGINQIKKLGDYLHYLYENPVELNLLYKELLIGVTGFFRDPEAFEVIRHKVIPQIFADKERGDQIRLWVAGCSTGEEAYSLAILLSDYMEKNAKFYDVKVFATDLDKEALEQAGKGVYPESIVADISREYLHNYFIRRGDSYEILRRVREMVIFAQQNIIDDPPFSKIDLISCRNVLIYLQPVLQKKVLAAFQFSLNPDGFLFLGTSETVGDMADYFVSFDNKWKIYQYKGSSRAHLNANLINRSVGDQPPARFAPYNRGRLGDGRRVGDDIYRYLIEMFLPPTVIIDDQGMLVHAFGNVDQFLQVPSGGRVSLELLKMVREGLSIPLSTAIHKVLKDDKEDILYKNITLAEKQPIPTDGEETKVRLIDIYVKPMRDPASRQKYVLIQFRDTQPEDEISHHVETFDVDLNARQRIVDLEQELQFTRESLQATVEELETSNEELQATNEELLAANEELQSTNEELQSVNEELVTVNAEYQAKIQELMDLNADLNNLFSSTDIGTIFLDRFLRIRRFTPAVQREIHLLEQDVGRPIGHISHNFVGLDLVQEVQAVIKTLTVREIEVQSSQKRWYLMKFHPYYTLDKRPDGVVVSMVDITELKESDEQVLLLSSALEQSPLLKVLINLEGNITYVNPRMIEMIAYTPKEVIGLPWKELLSKLKAEAEGKQLHTLQNEIKEALQQGGVWKGDLLYTNKQGKTFWGYSAFSTIYGKEGQPLCYLWVVEDISDRKRVEEELQQSEAKYRKLFEEMAQGVVYQDYKGEIISFNPAALKILGLTEDEILGRTSHDPRWRAIREDGSDLPGDQHPAMVALHTGKEVRNMLMGVFNPKDDQYHWIYVNSLPQFHPGEDHPYQVISTFTDVTALFKAQKALEEAQGQLLAVLDVFEHPIAILNEEGRLQICNQKARQEWFGLQVGGGGRCPGRGRLMSEYIPAEENEKFSQCLQQALAGEISRLRMDDQRITWILKPLVSAHSNNTSVLIMEEKLL